MFLIYFKLFKLNLKNNIVFIGQNILSNTQLTFNRTGFDVSNNNFKTIFEIVGHHYFTKYMVTTSLRLATNGNFATRQKIQNSMSRTLNPRPLVVVYDLNDTCSFLYLMNVMFRIILFFVMIFI